VNERAQNSIKRHSRPFTFIPGSILGDSV